MQHFPPRAPQPRDVCPESGWGASLGMSAQSQAGVGRGPKAAGAPESRPPAPPPRTPPPDGGEAITRVQQKASAHPKDKGTGCRGGVEERSALCLAREAQ